MSEVTPSSVENPGAQFLNELLKTLGKNPEFTGQVAQISAQVTEHAVTPEELEEMGQVLKAWFFGRGEGKRGHEEDFVARILGGRKVKEMKRKEEEAAAKNRLVYENLIPYIAKFGLLEEPPETMNSSPFSLQDLADMVEEGLHCFESQGSREPDPNFEQGFTRTDYGHFVSVSWDKTKGRDKYVSVDCNGALLTSDGEVVMLVLDGEKNLITGVFTPEQAAKVWPEEGGDSANKAS